MSLTIRRTGKIIDAVIDEVAELQLLGAGFRPVFLLDTPAFGEPQQYCECHAAAMRNNDHMRLPMQVTAVARRYEARRSTTRAPDDSRSHLGFPRVAPRLDDRSIVRWSRPMDRSVDAVIIGMGYVGLPLAREASAAGLSVIGLDVNQKCRRA